MAQVQWEQVRIFLSVVHSGSFSSAARDLDVNQATVSRQIARLEDVAGTALFLRDPTGTRLSQAGQELLEAAGAVDQAMTDFQAAVERIAKPSAEVTVSATPGTAYYLIEPLLAGSPLGPLSDVLATTRVAEPPAARIVGLPCNDPLAIRVFWHDSAGNLPGSAHDRVVKLADIGFRPFFSDRYLKRGNRVPESFDDLKGHDLITLPAYNAFDRALGPWNGLLGTPGTRLMSEWSTGLERALVLGRAVALLPDYTPTFDRTAHTLSAPLPQMGLSLYCAAPLDGLKERRIRAMFEFIRSSFQAGQWAMPAH